MATYSKDQTKPSIRLRGLILTGLLTALVFVATMSLHIPNGVGGVIHLGDGMLYLAAIVFGWKYGAASGAIGMSLFNILSPYAIWAPYTFVIKGLMGIVVGTIAWSGGHKGKNLQHNIIAMIAGGIIMIVGYYFAEWMITGSPFAPMASIIGNVLQATGSTAVAIPLITALRRIKLFDV